MIPPLRIGAALALAFLFSVSARAEPLRLTEADSGQNFVVRKGDEVELRLRENASTGFAWAAAQEDGASGLTALGRDSNGSGARPGAPGEAVFRYRADVLGEAALSLRYARAWEKDAPPARTFFARFEIRP